MFDNLSSRERSLAMIVGSLVPIIVLFYGFLWFMDRYESNDSEIDDLTAQIDLEEDKTRRGILAAKRQRYYRKSSLPSTQGRAKKMYTSWLDVAVQKDAGMTYDGVRYKQASPLVYERETIATRNALTLRPKATLAQLVKFLHVFYSADHLHRINRLSIKPDTKSKRGKPGVLTGELLLDIEIETLSLIDGPERLESFPVWKNEIPDADEYSQRILARNIFGPANNTPGIDKPKTLSFNIAKSEEAAEGKFKTIQITGTDADKDDILAFELIEESGSDNAVSLELGNQPITASQRKISLRVPMQAKPARIPVAMAVIDDGLPAKRTEIKFTVVFKEPKKKAVVPDPVLVDMATLSFVKGLMKGVDGRRMALVYVKSEPHKLAAGDSIRLDDQEWKVTDVSKKQITFEVGGERRSYLIDNALSHPLKEDAAEKLKP